MVAVSEDAVTVAVADPAPVAAEVAATVVAVAEVVEVRVADLNVQFYGHRTKWGSTNPYRSGLDSAMGRARKSWEKA
jgi:hypothetical protein